MQSQRQPDSEKKEWKHPASRSRRATETDRFSLRSSIASPRVNRFTDMYRSHCNSSYVSTESHSSWGQSALVSGTGVLVGSDGNQLQDPLSSCPVHPPRSKINQDQVVVCSAWQEGGGWGAGGEPESCTAFVEMLLLPNSHYIFQKSKQHAYKQRKTPPKRRLHHILLQTNEVQKHLILILLN